MPLSAIDTISPAFEHTKQRLAQPFRFWQWTRLAFVGLLAGEMGSGGCNVPSNFNIPQQGALSVICWISPRSIRPCTPS